VRRAQAVRLEQFVEDVPEEVLGVGAAAADEGEQAAAFAFEGERQTLVLLGAILGHGRRFILSPG
jgi:hypothetical protein